MHLQLKNTNYSRLKMFIWVSLLVGCALCILQYLNIFLKVDATVLNIPHPDAHTALPLPVMLFIVMFHTMFPGIIILEEGTVKGLIYTAVLWFFYGVLIHSYTWSYSFYIPLTAPLTGCLVSIIRVLAWEHTILEEEKIGMKNVISSFIEPNVADMFFKNPDLVNQDGVTTNVTVMFADLRGFTRLCEIIPPDQVIAILRDCFGQLINIVRNNGGTVDKLIGDSMMVVWGNPIPLEDHAKKAVESAIEMQAMMQALKTKWQQKLGVDIRLGIGINTDEVVAGTIGSKEFSDYTVLGSGVNLASKLESICPGDMIVVSEKTMNILKDSFSFKKLGNLKKKNNGGSTTPVFRLVL